MSYDIQSKDPLIGPYAIQKFLRNAMVIALREIFATDSVYTYIADPTTLVTDLDNSVIEITDVAPFEAVKNPCIMVTSIGDRGSSFFFGDDLISENWENGVLVSETHGNMVFMNLVLTVRALDSIVRDEIADRLYIYLRTVRAKFAELGIECREISIGSPAEEANGGRMAFLSTITVNTISEWIIQSDVAATQRVTGVSVQLDTTSETP